MLGFMLCFANSYLLKVCYIYFFMSSSSRISGIISRAAEGQSGSREGQGGKSRLAVVHS